MKKEYKVLIVVSVILLIVIIAIKLFTKKETDFVVLLFPDKVFQYNEKNDKFISRLTRELNENNVYYIHLSSGKEVKSKLSKKDFWQYEENDDIINITERFIAVTENQSHSLVPFKLEKINNADVDEITELLKQQGIVKIGKVSLSQKVSIDLDNDGITEDIISVSNVFNPAGRDKDFSLVYIRKQGKTYMILNKMEKAHNLTESCMPFIGGFIDVNNDKIYEIIIGCSYYDRLGTKYSISRLEENGVRMLKSF